MNNVLVVDDEPQVLVAIRETLKRQGYAITTAGSGVEALGKLEKNFFRAVITDLRMPDVDGMGILKEVKRLSPVTPVIFLTGHGSVANAVDALKHGVFDYLMKPFSSDQLLEVVKNATDGSPEQNGQEVQIFHRDPRMDEVLSLASQAALSSATVLIEAESGTGKELLARYIHGCSARAGRPFVAVNCAAVPEDLLESEMFGHEKGAFTGAWRKQLGKFELANGGTILLDEIGEMSASLQAKLLRVLQEGQIDRVGGQEPLDLDLRVIATTNRDLGEAIAEGRFRRDLYYRLNVIPLSIPPLRDRRGDIPLLVNHFCQKYRAECGEKEFSQESLSFFQRYDWPGNVRELENITRRAMALCRNPVISPADLFTRFQTHHQGPELKAGTSLKDLEKQIIGITLEETGGNRTRAAEMLGISLRTLRNKLREYRDQGEDW